MNKIHERERDINNMDLVHLRMYMYAISYGFCFISESKSVYMVLVVSFCKMHRYLISFDLLLSYLI